MKAALLNTWGEPLRIEDLPDPQPNSGEAVVEVLATPVLGYYKEVFSGKRSYPLNLPAVPGCGSIGRIAAVGPDSTRLQTGDLVYCHPMVRSRDEPRYPNTLLQGLIAPGRIAEHLQAHYPHGGFAERMLLPLENAVPLAGLEHLDPARLCWLNTALVPFGGLLAAGLQPGETVLISGATGYFGSAGVAVALALGAGRVIAPGRNRQALGDLVAKFGRRLIAYELSGDDDRDRAGLQKAAQAPIDRVLDLLPHLTDASAVRNAILTLRPYGTAVLMGGVDTPLDLPYKEMMRNCLTVRGQYMYGPEAPRQLASLILSGALDLSYIQVAKFDLDSSNQAVEYAAAHYRSWQLTVLIPRSQSASSAG